MRRSEQKIATKKKKIKNVGIRPPGNGEKNNSAGERMESKR